MLEKPDIQDDKIIACVGNEYGLSVTQITFLPLGADVNTAVYRLVTTDGTPYFLKLRKADFDKAAVSLAKFFSDQDITQVIPPLVTKSGQLWGETAVFRTILYPFIEGGNGYEVDLQDFHWSAFGTALKKIHTTTIPSTISDNIRKESYSPQYREAVKQFLTRIEDDVFDDFIATKLASFLKCKRVETMELIERAEQLAQRLQAQTPEMVVCHSDIHAGNLLIGNDGDLYIVDWDEPTIAPKERDLMYVGSGLISDLVPQEEEALFYRTYGQTKINTTALAYYRYERIIQDIAAFCKRLLSADESEKDREQFLRYLTSNYESGGTIEIAYQADKTGVE